MGKQHTTHLLILVRHAVQFVVEVLVGTGMYAILLLIAAGADRLTTSVSHWVQNDALITMLSMAKYAILVADIIGLIAVVVFATVRLVKGLKEEDHDK